MDHKPFGSMGDDRYHAIAREIAGKGRQARGVIGRLLGEPEPKPQIVPVEPEPEPKPETRPEQNKTTRINDAIAEAVSMVQPLANSRRIIIRAALSPTVGFSAFPFETIREIAHHLLMGAVQFTPAGGQVVVSTALTDDGATVLRFRDNGIAPARRRAGNGGQRLEHDGQDNTHMSKAESLQKAWMRASWFMPCQMKACWWKCLCRKPAPAASLLGTTPLLPLFAPGHKSGHPQSRFCRKAGSQCPHHKSDKSIVRTGDPGFIR